MNINFIPTKNGVKAGCERKDQGSERFGLWKTRGFGEKIVRRKLEWHMEMTNIGRTSRYSLTTITNARKFRMI